MPCSSRLLSHPDAVPSQEAGTDPAAQDAGPSVAEPDVAGADPDELEVISGWIGALSEGDVEAAAGYFAVPSTAQNGPLLVRIRDESDAVAFNETLPCGGAIVSAETVGDFTTATFELSERPGGGCGDGHRRNGFDLVRDRGREDRRMAPCGRGGSRARLGRGDRLRAARCSRPRA